MVEGNSSFTQILRKKTYGEEFYDLLYRVMRYSPHRRITPVQALQHPFFDELRDQATYTKLKKEYQIPDLFDFATSREATQAEMQALVPEWYN